MQIAPESQAPSRLSAISPLRYPGGKANFTHLLANIIKQNDLTGCNYYEPFAGGAGAALNLLRLGHVSQIFLNDLDWSIYCFWRAAITQPLKFQERILNVRLSIDEWRSQKIIHANQKSNSWFDVGFATFYLNRCNRSGIIRGSGPVGGLAQDGEYSLASRFPREELANRICRIAKLKNAIFISNEDALNFVKNKVPIKNKKTFCYLDPPYIEQGRRLYYDACTINDHTDLAKYLMSLRKLRWLVSYDKHRKLREIYKGAKIIKVTNVYKTNLRIRESEIIIYPQQLFIQKTTL